MTTSRTVDIGLLNRYPSGAFICFVPRGLTRLLRCSCSGHNTVNGAGIGCADHTPSMLNVLLLVVHRNRCLYLRGRAPEVYLAAYLRCH